MEKVKLTFGETLKDSIGIAMKNFGIVLGSVFLYAITAWIPYINIGTTIAIALLPAELAKGNSFSPTAIFDKKYREMMSDYFIIAGLVSIGISVGFALMLIPGIIISLAWSLSTLLVLDKKQKFFDALKNSYNITNGNKWTMFLVPFVFIIIVYILMFIFMLIPFIGIVLMIALLLIFMAISVGIQASFYRQLVVEPNKEKAE